MSVLNASYPFSVTLSTVTARDDYAGTKTTTTETVRCQISGPGNKKFQDDKGHEFVPRFVLICKGLVAKRDALVTLPAQFGLPADLPIRSLSPYANFRGNEYVTEVAV